MKKPQKLEFFAQNGLKVKNVSCSKSVQHNHTGCVTEDGRLFMWGDPYKGQLGHYVGKEKWTHKEKNLYSTPLEIDLSFLQPGDRAFKVENAGIHSSFLTEQGRIYTFGCGSDGRLGHPEYEGYTYLYKESQPKLIESLAGKRVVDIACSYYHTVAIVI